MKELKAGSIATLRTTGEPLFILEVRSEQSSFPGLSGKMVTVRRPITTENGLQHEVTSFHIEEVEDTEAAKERAVSEYLQFQAQAKANEAQVESVTKSSAVTH